MKDLFISIGFILAVPFVILLLGCISIFCVWLGKKLGVDVKITKP